jgi:LPS export ABC transporter permease LptG
MASRKRTVRSSFLLYVLKEALPFTFLAFFILTTLVFIQQASKYPEITLSIQTSPIIVRQFLLSLLPPIVVITLPVSLLLGTVITCSRLSSDGELTAAQSLGMSQLRLSLPFLTLGLLGTLLTGYFSLRAAPLSLKRLNSLRAEILFEGANTQIKPHTFITTFPGLLLYIQNIDAVTNEWVGVFALQNDTDRKAMRVLTAERGQFRLSSTPTLKLEAELNRGVSLEYENDPAANLGPAAVSHAADNFQKLSIRLADHEGEDALASQDAEIKVMSLRELKAYAATTTSIKEKARAITERHRRYAFPFACLILTAIAFVTAIQGRQFSTRPRTVIAILFIAMIYYLALIVGHNLSSSGRLPPWFGSWFANIVGAAITARALITGKAIFPFLAKLSLPGPAAKTSSELKSQYRAPIRNGSGIKSLGGWSVGIYNLISFLLVSEVAKYYFIALAALVMTSIIFTLIDLIPSMIRSDTSLFYAGSYLGYLAPQFIYVASPFAMLVGLLMGLNVLSRTNQLTAIASAGQGKMRIIASGLSIAALVGGGLWFLSNYILPYTNREQDLRYNKIKGRLLEQTTIAFGKKWVYGSNNTIYSFKRIDPDNSLIGGSVYHLTPDKGVLDSAMNFKQAAQTTTTTWKPLEGWAETISPELVIIRTPFEAADRVLHIEDGPNLFKRTVNQSSKLSAHDLKSYISQLKAIGIATLDLQIDLSKRLAFPFSCITLAFLAVPFVSIRQSRRASPLLSVAIAVGISLVFWLLMNLFEAAGKQNSLPIGVAVWAPQILFGALGLSMNFFRYRTQ